MIDARAHGTVMKLLGGIEVLRRKVNASRTASCEESRGKGLGASASA